MGLGLLFGGSGGGFGGGAVFHAVLAGGDGFDAFEGLVELAGAAQAHFFGDGFDGVVGFDQQAFDVADADAASPSERPNMRPVRASA